MLETFLQDLFAFFFFVSSHNQIRLGPFKSVCSRSIEPDLQ